MDASIKLYGAVTGNCLRAAIALEEAGVPFHARRVDLSARHHQADLYLALNPAGKVPVLVDRSTATPFVLTQSNAIVFNAEQRNPGSLFPEHDPEAKVRSFERYFYFVTDVIAVSHSALALRQRGDSEQSSFLNEKALDALIFAERFLADGFMSGDRFTATDILAFTIADFMKADLRWAEHHELEQWFQAIGNRPAVRRGMSTFNLQ